MPGKPVRPRASTAARVPLDEGTTHVLHFEPCCGAVLSGLGFWVLMTAADYRHGGAHSGRADWAASGGKRTPVSDLAAWVSAKAGYRVTLIRSDAIIDPEWSSLMAYQIRRAAS